ncbi:MAG: DUF429 domain-containing protein [Pseudomonadota bacterium]
MRQLVGVDGCKAGWVAVSGSRSADLSAAVYSDFEELMAAMGEGAIVAIDMPIGLPERIDGSGRVAEQAVRSLLGARQSSVFTIPARAAVELGVRMTGRTGDDYPLHQKASALAKTLSDPPKGVSIQAFYLFPKILEVDTYLRDNPEAVSRVFESHPEVAFRALNDDRPMALPKKIKGKVNQAGMAERRELLTRHGLDAASNAPFLHGPAPRGAGLDDVMDASVCWLIAQRIAGGLARPYPDPPGRDAHGLPIAIWA